MQFVWTYRGASARSDELRWSMRSVRHSFPNATITLVGDAPKWFDGRLLRVKQNVNGTFGGYKDLLRKLVVAANSPDVEDRFVWMTYNTYLFNRLTETDLLTPRHNGTFSPDQITTWNPTTRWDRLRRKTLLRLVQEQQRTINYVVDMPQVIEKRSLLKLIGKYQLLDNSQCYRWELLYGNEYYRDSIHHDQMCQWITEPPQYSSLTKLWECGPRIVHNNRSCWNEDLRAFLFERYCVKCDFEKMEAPFPRFEKCNGPTEPMEEVSRFIEYLHGKKIAVVGNGVPDQEYGETIDGFDVVIRFNNYQIQGYEKLVGSKTNVWAHCMNKNIRHRQETYEFNVCPAPRSGIQKDKLSRSLNRAPCIFGPMFLYQQIGFRRPSTGIAMINWLWRSGIRFETFCFDGFESGHYFDKARNQWHFPSEEKKAYARFQDRKNVVALIPFAGKDKHRVRAFEYVRKWAESRFDKVVVSTSNESVFNKSKLINIGLEKIRSQEIVAILDADCVISDEMIAKGIAVARTKDVVVFPWDRLKRLSEDETRLVLDKPEGLNKKDWVGRRIKSPGGCFFVVKSTLDFVGGFDERFIEWGGEDNAIQKMVSLCVGRPIRLDGTMVHLWHPVNRKRPNRKVYRQYKRLTKLGALKLARTRRERSFVADNLHDDSKTRSDTHECLNPIALKSRSKASQKLKIITVLRSGGEYDETHVHRLRDMCRKFMPSYEFCCLTDMNPECETIPIQEYWPGWWSKLELFRLEEPYFFFDLDTTITGNMEGLLNKFSNNDFTILRHFRNDYSEKQPGGFRPKSILVSCCFCWTVSQKPIFDIFKSRPEHFMATFRGDQDFIQDYFFDNYFVTHNNNRNCKFFQDESDAFVSFKLDIDRGKKFDPSKHLVVLFHGKPRPWNQNVI